MVRRLRRLPPPPSENTLLVKDDTQDGGLGWKNVGNVIGGALNARQNIMANYIYTDQNSIFISHRTDPERNYTMSVNSRTLNGTGPAPSIIPCSKFVFYNGDGAGTKTDIEAKNFIGNLTGNADSASYANYASTTSFSNDYVHVSFGGKYKFEENTLYLLKMHVYGDTKDTYFITFYHRGDINALAVPTIHYDAILSYDFITFSFTEHMDENYEYEGTNITAHGLRYDYNDNTFSLLTGIKVSYDLKKIK